MTESVPRRVHSPVLLRFRRFELTVGDLVTVGFFALVFAIGVAFRWGAL